jgi:hypothetical protein
MALNEHRLLRAAGILGWGVVGLPSVGDSLAWTAAWLLFGAAFLWTTRPGETAHGLAGLRLQALAAGALMALGSTALDAVCFAIVAVQLPALVPEKPARLWMLAQTAVLAVCFWDRLRPSQALAATAAWAGLQALAFEAAALVEREARARRELARLNAELQATLARLLLADVRAVAGTRAEDGRIDLAGSIRSLVEGLPEPRVHLSIPDGLEVRDPALAVTVFRCVREAVANAVRHSGAANLRIGVEWRPHGLEVTSEDDGRGAETPALGNGLRGMKERLGRLGGTLQIDTAPGAGFRLRARLPIPTEAP